MGPEFVLDKPTRYLQYLDTNNLYGWAMFQPLPTSGFKWVDIKPGEIRKLSKRKYKGYLVEVDVKYPRELHDSHYDLPNVRAHENQSSRKIDSQPFQQEEVRHPH